MRQMGIVYVTTLRQGRQCGRVSGGDLAIRTVPELSDVAVGDVDPVNRSGYLEEMGAVGQRRTGFHRSGCHRRGEVER